MKSLTIKFWALLIAGGLFLQGCDTVKNANNTQKGAGIGAVAGGVLGGILGNNIGGGGNGALGAIIGAAVGGTAGGVIGNSMDKQAKAIEQTLPGAEVIRTEEGIQVILDENSDVKFEYNKSDLTTVAKANLDKLVPIFNEYPDTNLLVAGYTDGVGSQGYNLPLSEKRAASVINYLKTKNIPASRLHYKGFGIEHPRADNATAEGRAQNRRVEFIITANEKMVQDAKRQAGE